MKARRRSGRGLSHIDHGVSRVCIFRILNKIFCMHYALEEVGISSLSLPLDQGVIPGFTYKKFFVLR